MARCVKAWVTVACLASPFVVTNVIRKLPHVPIIVPELLADSVTFCVLVFLENSHNRGQLELLCIVSHNKLEPEPTAQRYFLHFYMSFYDFCFCKLPLGWTRRLERHLHQYKKPFGVKLPL